MKSSFSEPEEEILILRLRHECKIFVTCKSDVRFDLSDESCLIEDNRRKDKYFLSERVLCFNENRTCLCLLPDALWRLLLIFKSELDKSLVTQSFRWTIEERENLSLEEKF